MTEDQSRELGCRWALLALAALAAVIVIFGAAGWGALWLLGRLAP
jgi:hypothetical protein